MIPSASNTWVGGFAAHAVAGDAGEAAAGRHQGGARLGQRGIEPAVRGRCGRGGRPGRPGRRPAGAPGRRRRACGRASRAARRDGSRPRLVGDLAGQEGGHPLGAELFTHQVQLGDAFEVAVAAVAAQLSDLAGGELGRGRGGGPVRAPRATKALQLGGLILAEAVAGRAGAQQAARLGAFAASAATGRRFCSPRSGGVVAVQAAAGLDQRCGRGRSPRSAPQAAAAPRRRPPAAAGRSRAPVPRLGAQPEVRHGVPGVVGGGILQVGGQAARQVLAPRRLQGQAPVVGGVVLVDVATSAAELVDQRDVRARPPAVALISACRSWAALMARAFSSRAAVDLADRAGSPGRRRSPRPPPRAWGPCEQGGHAGARPRAGRDRAPSPASSASRAAIRCAAKSGPARGQLGDCPCAGPRAGGTGRSGAARNSSRPALAAAEAVSSGRALVAEGAGGDGLEARRGLLPRRRRSLAPAAPRRGAAPVAGPAPLRRVTSILLALRSRAMGRERTSGLPSEVEHHLVVDAVPAGRR